MKQKIIEILNNHKTLSDWDKGESIIREYRFEHIAKEIEALLPSDEEIEKLVLENVTINHINSENNIDAISKLCFISGAKWLKSKLVENKDKQIMETDKNMNSKNYWYEAQMYKTNKNSY